MKRIVVALGGNALGNTPEEQKALVKETAKHIASLIELGNEVILAHGNGPQVGMIHLGFTQANQVNSAIPEMPFPECGAMSQGYIGFHLQNALQAQLRSKGITKTPATIITQVEVDPLDPAFDHPTKPIGSFYSKEVAQQMNLEKGYTMVEDAGRGYRRVVASPVPINIVEIDMIRELVKRGYPIITCGGGGIPVIRKDNQFIGVPAVIDKDHASAKLAELLEADLFIILTAVKKVCLHFGKPNQVDLDILTVQEANQYIQAGHFAKGSMLPKVIAATNFASSKMGRESIIAALEEAKEALEGNAGTKVVWSK